MALPSAVGYRPACREDLAMAKNGFKLIDAEMHVMEPTDLWQRYIDPELRERAPRLFGAAAVSPHDVGTAVDEPRRAVAELGMKAVFLRPNIYNDRAWHDPCYDPLWAACQELNVPVGFHETTGSRMKAAGADRFQNLGIAHIPTHPMEQMLTFMDVIMGGVMERFPRL